MAVRNNILEQAGEYTLEVCDIISYKVAEDNKPRGVNIKGIVGSIELTENIFEHCMVGKLQVYDAQDIRTILPITGLDKLHLKFSTPGMPGVNFTEESGKAFQIYKIERINQDPKSPRAQGYDIFFTSKEFYYNHLTKVSRAYSGPIEDAVEDILRNKKYLNSNSALTFEPTKTNSKYVIPNLRPFDAIMFLCTQAISQKYNNAGYCFYETPSGYFFRSLESMYAVNGAVERPVKFDYQYQVTNVGLDPNTDMHSVISYRFAKPVNTLENMRAGMYANKLIVHDAFNKTIKTHNYDYYQSFGDNFHIETEQGNKTFVKQLLPFAYFDDTKKDISQFPDSRTSVVSETSKVHNDFEFVPTKDTLPSRISQTQSLNNNILKLNVHGNSLLCAGDIISFDMPLLRPVADGEKQLPNPRQSGRYLIAGIKHTIAGGKYQMTLRCCKDAVKEGYLPETNTYQSIKQEKEVYDIYEEDERIMASISVHTDYT